MGYYRHTSESGQPRFDRAGERFQGNWRCEMDGAAEAIARLVWFCFITPIKIGWFVVKFIGQFVFGVSKDLAQHKKAYGSLSQQAMPLVATTDSEKSYAAVSTL